MIGRAPLFSTPSYHRPLLGHAQGDRNGTVGDGLGIGAYNFDTKWGKKASSALLLPRAMLSFAEGRDSTVRACARPSGNTEDRAP